MFPTLKCSSLRSRPHQKGISLECVSAAESKPYDDMKISCSPIEKFTSCSSQNGNRTKTDCKVAADQQNYFNVYKDYSDCSIHSDVYTQNNDKYRYSSDDSFSQISSTTKITDVILEKDEEGSLGITLQGGVHPNPEYSRPIFITYVKPDGPADKEGTIQTGDRLLAIDGYALSDVSLSETYALLRQLYSRCTARLTIEYDVTLVGNFTGPMLVEMESPRSHQLGLTLTNTPYNAAVLIDEIRTGSIAERCGALHAGDQILAVNETRVEGSKIAATEVYKMLRQCGGTGSVLILEVLPFNEFAKSQLKSTDFGQCDYYNIPAISQYLLPYSAASRVAPFGYNIPSQHYDVPSTVRSKPNNTKQMTLSLHSNDKVGYGLSVFCLPNNPKIIIHSLTPEGPAERSEVLQIGDEILTVNDCPLTGVTSDPQPLHKVPGITLGTVVLQIEYGVTNRSTSNDDIISIALNKYSHNKNLGIVLTDYRGFIIISSIKAGSVADRCGALSAGDTILSINNQAVSNCPVQDVSKMLEEELDSVVLEVKKVGSGFDISANGNGNENVEYTVELNKQGGTLGITITGSDNSPRQILISAVIPGGLVERTGALHVGDRVLAIDNNDTSCVLLSQAISYLQNAKEKVFIKVSRSPLNSQVSTVSHENDGRAYGSPGLYSIDSAVESWESSQEPSSSSNEIPVPFHQNHQLPENYKHDDRDDITEDHVLPTVVLQTTTDSVHRYGSLQRLRQPSRSRSPYCNPSSFKDNFEQPSVKYDYSTLSTKRNNEENEDTSSLDRNVDLIFKVADMDEERDNENEVYRVTLKKDPLYDDFGFSVSDGLYERGVFINRIRKGGPADNSGVLRPYDRIIQVNGIKTDNFDCCLTVPLVAAAGNKVTLKVTRKKLTSQQQGR